MPSIDISTEVRKPHEEFVYFMRGRTVILQQLDLDQNSSSYGEYIAPHNWKDDLDGNEGLGIEEGLQFEYTFVQDLSTIITGDSDIEISDFLIQAIVDYIKAQLIEDKAEFKIREYYMQRFRDRVEKYAGSRISGARFVKPSPYGII